MMRGLNLPNAITLGRIVLALGMAPLLLADGFWPRVAAFLVFVAAAVSDVWDGHLARTRNLITDFGKLMDPLADKLLLVATFVPFYLLSHEPAPEAPFPWFGGTFPLWVVLVIFGREAFITVFRGWAARRGVVLAAGQAGKLKAVFQNVFIGCTIVWYALMARARMDGWRGPFWEFWQDMHFAYSVLLLSVAIFLTVWSLAVYLRAFSLPRGDGTAP